MPSDSEDLIVGWFHAIRSARKAAKRSAAVEKLTAVIVQRLKREMARKAQEDREADAQAERDAWEREHGWHG